MESVTPLLEPPDHTVQELTFKQALEQGRSRRSAESHWLSHLEAGREDEVMQLYPVTNEIGWGKLLERIAFVEVKGRIVAGVSGYQLIELFLARPPEVDILLLLDPNEDLHLLYRLLIIAVKGNENPVEAAKNFEMLVRGHITVGTHDVRSRHLARLFGWIHHPTSAFHTPAKWEKLREAVCNDCILFFPVDLNRLDEVLELAELLKQQNIHLDTLYTSNIYDPERWMDSDSFFPNLNLLLEESESLGVNLVATRPPLGCPLGCVVPQRVELFEGRQFHAEDISVHCHKDDHDHLSDNIQYIASCLFDFMSCLRFIEVLSLTQYSIILTPLRVASKTLKQMEQFKTVKYRPPIFIRIDLLIQILLREHKQISGGDKVTPRKVATKCVREALEAEAFLVIPSTRPLKERKDPVMDLVDPLIDEFTAQCIPAKVPPGINFPLLVEPDSQAPLSEAPSGELLLQ